MLLYSDNKCACSVFSQVYCCTQVVNVPIHCFLRFSSCDLDCYFFPALHLAILSLHTKTKFRAGSSLFVFYRWIKIYQLDVTCFIISLFTAQHVLNISTSIFRSLRLIVDFISSVVLLWFNVCWCYGVVRLGWCGILMQAEALLQPALH